MENRNWLADSWSRRNEEGTTCKSWASEFGRVSDKELEKVFQIVSYRMEDEALKSLDLSFGSLLDYSWFQTQGNRLLKTYVHLVHGEMHHVEAEIKSFFETLEESIRDEYLKPDSARGVKYVLVGLKIQAVIESDDPNELEKLCLFREDADERFEDLSKSEKVAVLALKYYFMSNLAYRSFEKCRPIINQLLELEPENPEWHVALYRNFKHIRQHQPYELRYGGGQIYVPPSKPSAEEVNAIQDAVNLVAKGNKPYPYVIFANLACLVEIFRIGYDPRSTVQDTFQYGNHHFNSAEEIFAYLRAEAENALTEGTLMAKAYCKLGQIFSENLPLEFQDCHFAEKLVRHAMKINPRHASTYYQLAKIYAKRGMTEEAIFYTNEAFRLNRSNSAPLYHLLLSLMKDFDKKECNGEIERTFEIASTAISCIEDSKVSPDRIQSRINFLQGIYYVMTGRESEGVDTIMKFYGDEAYRYECYFKSFAKEVKTYQWPITLQTETFRRVYRAVELENSIKAFKNQEAVTKILVALQKALEGIRYTHQEVQTRDERSSSGGINGNWRAQ